MLALLERKRNRQFSQILTELEMPSPLSSEIVDATIRMGLDSISLTIVFTRYICLCKLYGWIRSKNVCETEIFINEVRTC